MLSDIVRIKGLRTPFYIYSKESIITQFQALYSMPNAFGLEVAYAMKAHPNQETLRILYKMGSHIDASSFNEVKRALKAECKPSRITYTTQQILLDEREIKEMKDLVTQGMKFNVCSLRQFELIRDTAKTQNIKLCVRVHPGKGTGDEYSCFGVHLRDLRCMLESAKEDKIEFDEVHIHVGSGGKVEQWKQHIIEQMDILRNYFTDFNINKINFGGGFKVSRMPEEESFNTHEIGEFMKMEVERFGHETKTKPISMVESGTFIVANSGYIVTNVIDIKRTEKFEFLVLNGGMEVNTRPLLYGSQHPFSLYSSSGVLKSTEGVVNGKKSEYVVVGRCCESGDSQTLEHVSYERGQDTHHSDKFKIAPRRMAEAEIGDFLVIGGTGAYCSSMTLHNYNSHFTPAEYLMEEDGSIRVIRKEQTLEQMIGNEVSEMLKI